jgi:hypothetical protein
MILQLLYLSHPSLGHSILRMGGIPCCAVADDSRKQTVSVATRSSVGQKELGLSGAFPSALRILDD